MANWQTCNVVKTVGNRQLWQFSPDRTGVRLDREHTPAAEDALPRNATSKGWSALWNKKLNIAWLPPGSVFIQVLQLPVSETDELLSMVEFQLEKVSPFPINQVVWSMELLPQPVDGQQTVVVLVAERQQVENFLGQLETEGFVADVLEVPMLDQILATEIKGDGVWVYAPQEGINTTWITTWWQGGCLRHLGLIYLPENETQDQALQQQLRQMAWAGEIEGWLTGAPQWHLVADSVHATMFAPAFRELAGQDPDIIPPHPPGQVAALTAKRSLQARHRAGLLPVEVAERYRAAFVDGLWMTGIVATILVYLFGTLVYFGVLEVLKFQVGRAEAKVADVSGAYTNALQLKAQIQVLQDQQSFKYAALECWEATARNLPEGLTLSSLSLSRERTFGLYGTATGDQNTKVTELNAAMKKAELNGHPLFSKVNAPQMTRRPDGQVTWSFVCELNRLERE